MSIMSNFVSKYWCYLSISEYNYALEIEAVIHSHIDCFLINMLGPAGLRIFTRHNQYGNE